MKNSPVAWVLRQSVGFITAALLFTDCGRGKSETASYQTPEYTAPATPCTDAGDGGVVASYADGITELAMKKLYPNSGEQPATTLNEWSYDCQNDTYSLDVTSSWVGSNTAGGDECRAELRARCTVSASNSSLVEYSPVSRNDCMIGHDMADETIKILLRGLIESAASSHEK